MNRQAMEKILDAYEELVYERTWEIRPDLLKTLKALRHNCLLGSETASARQISIKDVQVAPVARLPLVGYGAGLAHNRKKRKGE